MRIASKADLARLRKGGELSSGGSGISGWASQQIEAALQAGDRAGKAHTEVSGRPRAQKRASSTVAGESPGEASVRLALYAAFGEWHRGGEVVQELIPFSTRRFRCDFACPRWKLAIEIDGWAHHSRLKDHHGDRERGLFFASHDWLAFRVSHDQAINNPGMLVDAMASAMTYRRPTPRDSITLEPVPHKHGVWYRLRVNDGR